MQKRRNMLFVCGLAVLTACLCLLTIACSGAEKPKFYNRVEDGVVYYYNGAKRTAVNKQFVEIDGNTYYAVNNRIVYGCMILDDQVYDFGADGVLQQKTFNNEFFTVKGDTYYAVNNKILRGYKIINEKIYFFDDNGVLGKLNDGFITFDDNQYYIINNEIIKNYYIINNKVYNFGDDGINKNQEINNQFITIGEDEYYVVNNSIVKNYYIIDDKVYNFGNDGKNKNQIITNKFVTVNGKEYYAVNNEIIKNYYIINNKVYNFGDDGVNTNQKFSDGIIVIGGKQYYIINNTISRDYCIIGDVVYKLSEDGAIVQGETINGFIKVAGNQYYVINNKITKGYYIIDDKIYNFGTDGINQTQDISNEFVTVNGTKYYVINNKIAKGYQIIGDKIYNFGTDGISQPIADGFLQIENKTYYVLNNTFVKNYYVVNGDVYCFDPVTGAMKQNETYNGFQFDADGKMQGGSGAASGDEIIIESDGKKYMIYDNAVYVLRRYSGKVIISDTDNQVLSGAQCKISWKDRSYEAVTDSNGAFVFNDLPQENLSLQIKNDGYITVNVELTAESDYISVIIDKDVSNTLSGVIYIADNNTDYTDNSPLVGAQITLKRTSSSNVWEYSAISDSAGKYQFANLTAGTYLLTVAKTGYKTLSQQITVHYNQKFIQNMALEMIHSESMQKGSASGTIKDGRTGDGISGLTLYVYKGVNITSGECLATIKTGINGKYSLNSYESGNYTLKIKDERTLTDERDRYGESTFTVKVLPGESISNQNATVSNSQGLYVDSMRIVLTWGSQPNDLDSHLLIQKSNGESGHIYYRNTSYDNATLDVDETKGYGPETITISQMKNGEVYKYYVQNYSTDVVTTAQRLSKSGAIIKIYLGNNAVEYYTFYVPSGTGAYWNLFTYDKATGTFNIINEISDTPLE